MPEGAFLERHQKPNDGRAEWPPRFRIDGSKVPPHAARRLKEWEYYERLRKRPPKILLRISRPGTFDPMEALKQSPQAQESP
jgi:hypothetical protein